MIVSAETRDALGRLAPPDTLAVPHTLFQQIPQVRLAPAQLVSFAPEALANVEFLR